jgi:hypothetical protein
MAFGCPTEKTALGKKSGIKRQKTKYEENV